jgi:hypothetical protein
VRTARQAHSRTKTGRSRGDLGAREFEEFEEFKEFKEFKEFEEFEEFEEFGRDELLLFRSRLGHSAILWLHRTSSSSSLAISAP